MRNLAKILVVFFFLLAAQTSAEITSVSIFSDDRQSILFETFEFTQNGHVSVDISSVSVTSTSVLSPPPANLSRIGFYLVSSKAYEYTSKEEETNSCDLDSKYISLLFTFQDLSETSFNKLYNVTIPDSYSLMFTNCNPLSHVTMDVRMEFYNTYNNGFNKDYLPAGLTNLPSLYFNFSLVYLCFLGFWIFICIRNYQSLQWMHLVMGVLLLTKGVNLFSAAEVAQVIKVTGTRAHYWDIVFYIFQFFRFVLVCTIIPMEYYRTEVLTVVIPLQFLANIVSLKIGETSPVYIAYSEWDPVLAVVHSICWGAISSQMVELLDTDEEAAGDYSANFIPLNKFHILVVPAYLFCDLIGGLMTVNRSTHWGYNGANETVSLVLLMVMFYVYRPFEKTRYLPVKSVCDEEFEF